MLRSNIALWQLMPQHVLPARAYEYQGAGKQHAQSSQFVRTAAGQCVRTLAKASESNYT